MQIFFIKPIDPIAMEVVEETGAYAVFDLEADGRDTFTFVDAQNEDNYLVMRNADGEWVPALFTCSEVWEDDTWKGDPVKMIDLDLTDNSKYAWSTDIPEGLENVTTDKAQSTKVIINGMLYIVQIPPFLAFDPIAERAREPIKKIAISQEFGDFFCIYQKNFVTLRLCKVRSDSAPCLFLSY